MATREPLSQNSPLVELTGLVLSYVILKAESADFVIQQSPLFGLTIEVGGRTFNGKDESKVVEQFLRYLIEKEVTMTKEDFDDVELDEEEPEDIDALAEKFAEGGLSEFGEQVRDAKLHRLSVIEEALRECKLSGSMRIVDLLPELQEKTQLPDLEMAEVLERINDIGIENLFDDSSDATVPVVRSIDKPN